MPMRSNSTKARSRLLVSRIVAARACDARAAWYPAGLRAESCFVVAAGLLRNGVVLFALGRAAWVVGEVSCFDAAMLFSIVGFRWLKRKILWRLRNRLIVTYVFIGVIPAVLLIAMAFITLYGLAGQFAGFRGDFGNQLATAQLEAVNAASATNSRRAWSAANVRQRNRWQD